MSGLYLTWETPISNGVDHIYHIFKIPVISSCLGIIQYLCFSYSEFSYSLNFSSLESNRIPFVLIIWPIQLAFLSITVSNIVFFLSVRLKASSFVIQFVHLIFSFLLQHQILNLFRYFFSSFLIVHVSDSNNATLHTLHCNKFSWV